jgi:L-2-hydroxyglutarate oxidase LhgO
VHPPLTCAGQEALALEPLVSRDAQRYLWAPASSVAPPALYFNALLHDTVRAAGQRLRVITDRSVVSIRAPSAGAAASSSTAAAAAACRGDGGVSAGLDDGSFISCKHVFNCAGTGALALAKASGFGAKFLELPFRGMYFKVKGFAPKRLLYPVPDLTAPFLGVHWTIDACGDAKLGPSAMFTLADVHHPAPPAPLASLASKLGNLASFVTKQPQLALAGVTCDV